MEPGDAQDLAARIQRLEAELEAMGGRQDAREALETRAQELESEIDAARTRLDARGGRRRSLLDDVRIASPCPASWDEMAGDERVRHCKACDRQVFSLSAMTRLEAEQFLADNRTACVRLYRRFDGTVMTSDCPVGRRRMRVRNVIAAAGSAAVLAALAVVRSDPTLPDVRDAERGLDAAQSRAERVAESAKRRAPAARRVRTVRERERDIERALEQLDMTMSVGALRPSSDALGSNLLNQSAPLLPRRGDKK